MLLLLGLLLLIYATLCKLLTIIHSLNNDTVAVEDDDDNDYCVYDDFYNNDYFTNAFAACDNDDGDAGTDDENGSDDF